MGATVLFIQLSVVPLFDVGGARPDLALCYSLILGLVFRSDIAAISGAGLGAVMDLINGRFLGLFSLCYLSVGYFAGLVGQRINRDTLVTPLLLGFAGTVFKNVLIYFLLITAGGLNLQFLSVMTLGFVEALLNSLLAGMVFDIVLRIRRRLMTGASPLRLGGPWA